MARPAPMQTVELVEHDDDAPAAPAARLSSADRWRLVRRWAPVPIALVLALAGAQALDVARDRAALAALSATPGVVRPVDPDVRVLWTMDETLAGLVRSDVPGQGVLVGLDRPADGSQALVAFDEQTGERRWTAPLAPADPSTSPGSQLGGCVEVPHVSDRVACLVSDGLASYGELSAEMVAGDLSTVVVLDTSDGSVVAEQPAPGAVAFTVLPDAVVVAVHEADDVITLVATGLLDGAPRWRTPLPATEGPQGDAVMGATTPVFRTLDGVAAVVAPGRMVLLDHEGAVTRSDIDAGAGWRVDETTRAVTAMSVGPDGSELTTFVGREGTDVTVRGSPVVLSVDDGSMPGLELVSDSSLRAYDRGSPAPRWSVENLRATSALLLRGRLYAGSGRGLVAIDARTGEELWRTAAPEGRSLAGLVTDGRHLLSSQRPDPSGEIPGAGELAAYRLGDGGEDWRVDLPAGLTTVWSTGASLLGWSWGEAGGSVIG